MWLYICAFIKSNIFISDHMTSDQTPDDANPGTDHLATVITPFSERRPGSNIKPILPPIPTGRKTPAALSLSPSPSPNPAVREQGEADKEG